MKWEFGYTSQGILHVWTPPFGAARPGDGAVHDRIVLPDVEIPQGPLARIVGTALPVAYGALDRLALPVGDPHMELILRFLALLKCI